MSPLAIRATIGHLQLAIKDLGNAGGCIAHEVDCPAVLLNQLDQLQRRIQSNIDWLEVKHAIQE